jgi:hypothetical protein
VLDVVDERLLAHACGLASQPARERKIGQLEVAVRGDEHVVGFNVPVCVVERVHGTNRHRELADVKEGVGLG